MKIRSVSLVASAVLLLSVTTICQTSVVINTPGTDPAKPELSAAEQGLMDRSVLPKVRKKLVSEGCEETIEVAAILHGAFTKAGADQTLVFYQFCQTGNGLGSAAMAVFENGRVVGNYVSEESGWTVDGRSLPDINQNGLNEVALYYSGGMHQGAGGTGVDVVELGSGSVRNIGWYQAEGFTEDGPVIGYKVAVKPGKKPVFLREKYVQNSAGAWRKSGKQVPFKLGPAIGNFVVLK